MEEHTGFIKSNGKKLKFRYSEDLRRDLEFLGIDIDKEIREGLKKELEHNVSTF